MPYRFVDNQEGEPRGRFPDRWLVAAVMLTTTLFAALGWHVQNSYRVLQDVRDVYLRGEQLRDRSVELGLQLTGSANAFLAGGAELWGQSYHDSQLQLTALLQEASRVPLPDASAAALDEAIAAHTHLRRLESESLGLVGNEPVEVAKRILSGAEYQRQQVIFFDAMNAFGEGFQEDLAARLMAERDREIGSLVVGFLIFLMSVAFWLWLLRRLRIWEHALVQEGLERRRAEIQAQASAQQYRNLFEYASDAILIVDPATMRFLSVNELAVQCLGYTREELLQLRLGDIDTEVGCTPDGGCVGVLPANGRSVYERSYKRGDGAVFPVEVSGRPVDYGKQRVCQLFVRDVTERRRLQEQLMQAQKMEAMGQLASGIAHDFNNLLMAISGYTELAKDTLPGDHPAMTSLDRVEHAAEQAGGVTKALLTFSRKQLPEMHAIDLKALVHDMATFLKRVLPASIDLTTNTGTDPEIWVSADRTQMQQVLMNLAINAKDAMPDGGTLTLALAVTSPEDVTVPARESRPAETQVCLQVSDNGVGIPAEVQKRMFELFYTTKPRGYGTGLGLATVSSIVAQHGGRLEVSSKVGQGTTFSVMLPGGRASSDLPESQSLNAPKGQGELILLAEDYQYVREIMATALQSLGYRVMQAEDGLAFLDQYDRHRADARLLIVDSDMPGKSGPDCLREIRQSGDSIPTIIATGTETQVLPAQFGGNTALLRKPFQITQLGHLVARMIAGCPKEGPLP